MAGELLHPSILRRSERPHVPSLRALQGRVRLTCCVFLAAATHDRTRRRRLQTPVNPGKHLSGRTRHRRTNAKRAAGNKTYDVASFVTGVRDLEITRHSIPREITAPDASALTNLDWLPDGSGLLTTNLTATHTDLLLVRPNGRSTVLWSGDARGGLWAVPSRDGKRLALFMQTRQSDAFLIDLLGEADR